MKRLFFISLMIMLFVSLSAKSQNPADKICGNWLDEDKEGKTEIFERDGKYYGRLYWLRYIEESKPKKMPVDSNNPDESLRTRELIGMEFLTDFVYNKEENVWESGTVYDCRSGKTYRCIISFKDDKTLKIRGYIGISLIGANTYWTKVE